MAEILYLRRRTWRVISERSGSQGLSLVGWGRGEMGKVGALKRNEMDGLGSERCGEVWRNGWVSLFVIDLVLEMDG